MFLFDLLENPARRNAVYVYPDVFRIAGGSHNPSACDVPLPDFRDK